jgi:thymidine phosphorylase
MNESLAPCAGNAIEIRFAIDYLIGRSRPARLHEVTIALAAEMLLQGRLASNATAARQRLQAVLDSGAAAERFARMVAGLGGPADLLEQADRHLGRAPVVVPALSPQSGFVFAVDCRGLGMAVVHLGGGRHHPKDIIDHAVGLVELARLGQRVERGQALALVHAHDEDSARAGAAAVLKAYRLSETPPEIQRAIYQRIG